MQKNTKEKIYDNTIKGLAVIGLGVLLAFLVWGTSRMVNTTPSLLANVNSGAIAIKSQLFPAEKISLSFPQEKIDSEEALKGFYTYNGDKNLTLSYNCVKNVELSAKLPNEESFSQLSCNSQIYLDPRNSKFSIKASNTGNASASTDIILKTSNGKLKEQAVITVSPASETSSQDAKNLETDHSTDGKETGRTEQGGQETAGERKDTVLTFNDNGTSEEQRPDLTGEILKVGQGKPRPSGKGCEFISTSTKLKNGNIGAAQFSIENTGNTEAGKWNLKIIPPFTSWKDKDFENQSPLAPGDRIEYTACFKTALNEEKTFRVNIDWNDKVKEINEDDNILKKEVTYTKAD